MGEADCREAWYASHHPSPRENRLRFAMLIVCIDNQSVYVAVRSYDQDGNRSAWSAPIAGRSWALAPDGWSPLPGGTAYPDSPVRLLFAAPIARGTLSGRLVLRDSTGAVVAGTSELIGELGSDTIIGIRFVPAAPLRVGERYEVTVKGGSGGVIAEDNRAMPADYRWIFTVTERPLDPAMIEVPPEPEAPAPPPAEGGTPGQPVLPDEDGRYRVALPLIRQ